MEKKITWKMASKKTTIQKKATDLSGSEEGSGAMGCNEIKIFSCYNSLHPVVFQQIFRIKCEKVHTWDWSYLIFPLYVIVHTPSKLVKQCKFTSTHIYLHIDIVCINDNSICTRWLTHDWGDLNKNKYMGETNEE